jgi:DNA-binding transcriptional MocR family regulator
MAELGLDGKTNTVPFAAHGSAILVGSVGKTVWGGVRLGWIRADRSVIQRLVRARSAGDLGTPMLEQLLVLNLLEGFDAILESRRSYLRAGRDRLERLLAQRLPEWQVPHTQGGLTAWVNLGRPVSSQLALAARNEGLIIAAGPRFGVDGAFERFIRIPFSYGEDETVRGVDALAAAWASVGRGPAYESNQELASVV